MLGEILQSILQETKTLLSGTGATVLFKTNFVNKKMPDNNGNFVLLEIDNAPDTIQFPGGLTRCDWNWSFGSYNFEPNAYVDDDTPFSTSLLNFIDQIRQHFSLGAFGKGVVYSTGTLQPGIIYQVTNGTIVYNGVLIANGNLFTCLVGITTFTTPNNGYAVGTSWLTQGMVDIFNDYGFQFTLSGINAADAIDTDGLVVGFKIAFQSTAFDIVTQFTESDVVLTTVTQIQPTPPIS